MNICRFGKVKACKTKRHTKQNGGVIMVRKRKGNLLQRIMASLLSAVLIAGMALEAVPLAALAQEMPGGGITWQRKAS